MESDGENGIRVRKSFSFWMIMADGLIVDARYAPVEIQRIAYKKGLIPYVYAERGDE